MEQKSNATSTQNLFGWKTGWQDDCFKTMKSGVLFVGSLEFLTNLQKNHLIAIVLIDVTLKNNVWKNNSISRNNFIKFSDKGGYRQYIRETGRKKKKRPSKTGEKKKKRELGGKKCLLNCTALIYGTLVDHQSIKKTMLIFSRLN